MTHWRTAVGLGAMVALGAGLSACGNNNGGVTVFNETPTTTVPFTLSLEPSPVGPILTTGSGHTLYDFAPDTPTKSACLSSICVFLWPPLVVTGKPTVAPGLQAGLLGTLVRPDGATQVTYGGHPLYTWNSDAKAGMITGQAIDNEGGYWYVVGPNGHQITTPFSVER
jgi:predicted lipoprotein with Yx(FWY)xxD motif